MENSGRDSKVWVRKCLLKGWGVVSSARVSSLLCIPEWAKHSSLSLFVYNVLLEYSHAHPLIVLWLLSQAMENCVVANLPYDQSFIMHLPYGPAQRGMFGPYWQEIYLKSVCWKQSPSFMC